MGHLSPGLDTKSGSDPAYAAAANHLGADSQRPALLPRVEVRQQFAEQIGHCGSRSSMLTQCEGPPCTPHVQLANTTYLSAGVVKVRYWVCLSKY